MRLRARLALTVVGATAVLSGAWAWLAARQRDARLDDALREFARATLSAFGQDRCEQDPARFEVFAPTPREMPPRAPRPPEGVPRGGPGRPGEPPRPGPQSRPGEPGPWAPPDPRGEPWGGPTLPTGRAPSADRPGPPSDRVMPPREDGTTLWAYDASFASRNPRAPALSAALASALSEGATDAAGAWRLAARDGREVALRTAWPDGPCAFVVARRLHPTGGDREGLWLWGTLTLGLGVLLAVVLAAGPVVRRLRRLEARVASARESGWRESVPVAGDDEVASLARAFESAGAAVREHLGAAQARERALRAFVADTTHDVAIPLTVLQGHLAALRADAGAGRPHDAARVRQALEESHYVGLLLANLASAARLEAGDVHLHLRPVDLSEVVRRAVARHAPIARERGVGLEHAVPEAPVLVTGDETLLEQAVSNLVHNAVAYADEGGHAAVVLEAPRAPAGTFRLRVLDDGPGVSPEDLPRLAERAFRGAEARTRRPGGGGLGLAIVRGVAERHGFALGLANAVPHGLEAVLSGPLAPDAASRPTPHGTC